MHCPNIVGARVQRGHGLGSLFGDLIWSIMPLIKRGTMTLGKRALSTGVRIADDVISGQNIKTAAKRRVTDAGKDLLGGLLATPNVRPRKHIKLTTVMRWFSTVPRCRMKHEDTRTRRVRRWLSLIDNRELRSRASSISLVCRRLRPASSTREDRSKPYYPDREMIIWSR